MASPTDELCTRCGLCCDGTLFGDVELTDREADRLTLIGIEVEEQSRGAAMNQPCTALRGRRCSIYPHRPGSCRAFACRLLIRVERGTTSLARARAIVAGTLVRLDRVKALLGPGGTPRGRAPLDERCVEALDRARRDPARRAQAAALAAARSALRRRIRAEFLGEGSEPVL
jgi:hypothetical protein